VLGKHRADGRPGAGATPQPARPMLTGTCRRRLSRDTSRPLVLPGEPRHAQRSSTGRRRSGSPTRTTGSGRRTPGHHWKPEAVGTDLAWLAVASHAFTPACVLPPRVPWGRRRSPRGVDTDVERRVARRLAAATVHLRPRAASQLREAPRSAPPGVSSSQEFFPAFFLGLSPYAWPLGDQYFNSDLRLCGIRAVLPRVHPGRIRM
jgi:hypothetical protein